MGDGRIPPEEWISRGKGRVEGRETIGEK